LDHLDGVVGVLLSELGFLESDDLVLLETLDSFFEQDFLMGLVLLEVLQFTLECIDLIKWKDNCLDNSASDTAAFNR
jgi:hypothetical protein